MNKPIVIFGIGQLGGVFSRGFLRNNHPVYPITRTTDISELAQTIDPELILVCVTEADLQSALRSVPNVWKDRVAMIQNELLPKDWQPHNLFQPTVMSVWFEKKQGKGVKVLISSPTYGAKAKVLTDSLNLINIPSHVVSDRETLLFELVLKNLYILTTNIAGLMIEPSATVNDLRTHHSDLMRAVSADVLKLQSVLAGSSFDKDKLEQGMMAAFEGDLHHICMGRSAPARLNRVLEQAQQLQLSLPVLEEISNNLSG